MQHVLHMSCTFADEKHTLVHYDMLIDCSWLRLLVGQPLMVIRLPGDCRAGQ